MLSYPQLEKIVLFGTKTLPANGTIPTAIATSITLTNTYSDHVKSFATGGNSALVLMWKYTTGTGETGSSLDIQTLCSNDNVNFYNLTNESASTGTSTLTVRTFNFVGGIAATVYTGSYRLDITYPYVRVQVNESGVITNFGTLFMEATLGGY